MALADRIFGPSTPRLETNRSQPSVTLLNGRQRAIKRMFDVAVASGTLVFVWPVLLLASILVMFSSPGPVIYRHRRVGQGGKTFDVLKFRTMYTSYPTTEWQITVGGDPRVTPIGRWLRSTKFDELPQLWNVLRGEMSLVGWRPHVAGYPDRLAGPDAVLIDERPGITGAATLYFRDEERLLALADDPKRHYDDVIYPAKVKMDLEYFRAWSLRRDMACLIVTAWRSADRWFNVVPTVTNHAEATGVVSTVVKPTPQPPAQAHRNGNGYRLVTLVPVHSNGNGAALNGHRSGTNGNERVPSSLNGDMAHPNATIPMSGDDLGLIAKHVIHRSPAVIRIADDKVATLAAEVGHPPGRTEDPGASGI